MNIGNISLMEKYYQTSFRPKLKQKYYQNGTREREEEGKEERKCLVRGGLRLDMSHSQCLNSGKLLDTGRCGWWCPIESCPNRTLPFVRGQKCR